jgi:hypothetical protein
MIAPFLPSTRALSELRLGRERVNSTSSFIEQLGHGVVYELRTIVGMEPQNPEGELMQHRFQHRLQILFADSRGTAHDLPRGDGIHGIDVADAFLSFPVPLVDGIYTQVSGSTLRVR